MSKKNVSGESVANDSYPTPKPFIRAILGRLVPMLHLRRGFGSISIFDPCCGAGNVLDVADEFGLHDNLGLELQPELAEQARAKGHVVGVCNALESDWASADLTLSNPPYTLAAEFLARAIEAARSVDGTVSYLLRLGFLASEKRKALFKHIGMPDVDVVPRPSFCMTIRCRECGDRYTLPPDAARPKTCRMADPNWSQALLRTALTDAVACPGAGDDLAISTTDAADYAWMTWGPDTTGRVDRMEVHQ